MPGYFFEVFFRYEGGFSYKREIWASFFPWQCNDGGSLGLSSSTYVRMKLANYVPGSQWHIANVPMGSRWNDTSPAGTVPKWARLLLNNSALPFVDPRPLRHSLRFSPSAVSRISEKTCQIDGKPPPCKGTLIKEWSISFHTAWNSMHMYIHIYMWSYLLNLKKKILYKTIGK